MNKINKLFKNIILLTSTLTVNISICYATNPYSLNEDDQNRIKNIIDHALNNDKILYPDQLDEISYIINRNSKHNNESTYIKNSPYPNPLTTKIILNDNNPDKKEIYLSSESIEDLIPDFLPVKDESTILNDGHLLPNIAEVAMGYAKIIFLDSETEEKSLVTFRVYPCVAVILRNKTKNIIGLAHIPGAPTDSDALYKDIEAYDPLKEYDHLSSRKFNLNSLKKFMKQFLYIVADQNSSDLDIHIIGGYQNRFLLLNLVNIIKDLNYNIPVKNIIPSRLYSKESAFDPHLHSTLCLEITRDKIFILQNLSTLKNADRWLKMDWNSLSEILKNYNTAPYKKLSEYSQNQFDIITLEIIGKEQKNTYKIYTVKDILEIENIDSSNPSNHVLGIIYQALENPYLLAHLLMIGLNPHAIIFYPQETLFDVIKNGDNEKMKQIIKEAKKLKFYKI